jgi:pentatricopeptide repeat protein
LLPNDLILGNALIDMYAKSGILEEARRVSDELPARDVVTWTASIAGYVDCGLCEEALCMFRRMQIEGFSPNAITHACILKACGNIGSIRRGQEIHVTVAGGGGGGSAAMNVMSIANALLGMYAKCGDFARAREVFRGLPDPDAVSWNTLIGGYVQHGLGEEALDCCCCFERMQSNGICFTEATFVCVLAACAKVGALEQGRGAHMDAVRNGFFETYTAVGNALVDMYARCGLLGTAQAVFDSLPIQDVVSWNMLVAGYAEHGYGEEALSCADSMQLQGIAPDAITHLGALSGCARSVATCRGQETHASIAKMGSNDAQNNALIDMYAACGMLAEARHVFDGLPSSQRSIRSWTSLIAAYAQFGDDAAVHNLFDAMLKEGKEVDPIVLTTLLASCSHSGSVGLAQMYFETLIGDHSVIPTLENHICMVDAFGRAGQLERMMLLIETMPFCADSTLWHAALHSCRGRGNVELGSWAFQHALQLDAEDASAYLCIRNMYAVQCAT